LTLDQARLALIACLQSGGLEKKLTGPDGDWRALARNEIRDLRSEKVITALRTAEVSDKHDGWVLVDMWWIDLSKARFSATLSYRPYYESVIGGQFKYTAATGWTAAVDSFSHGDLIP
jgi:hypothetical protein